MMINKSSVSFIEFIAVFNSQFTNSSSQIGSGSNEDISTEINKFSNIRIANATKL